MPSDILEMPGVEQIKRIKRKMCVKVYGVFVVYMC
jgi:hypothetical protein